MESTSINLNGHQPRAIKPENKSSKLRVDDVFKKTEDYLNKFILFIENFDKIPNVIHELYIDCKKANKWFAEIHKEEIKNRHFDMRDFSRGKTAEFDNIFYIMYSGIIVHFDMNRSSVSLLFEETGMMKIESITSDIKKFRRKKQRRKSEIKLLINSTYGFESRDMPISKPKLNIKDNYNEDFREIHQIILKRLAKKNDKGLVLLHGKPGTGKTSYIRFLISSLKKKIIFLPPNLAGAIASPELISILIDHPNSIFVIEDAENIVLDREKNGDSPISALLNISDGLLSDCLNIQLICSFNTDISKVDNALMRKGRLIAKYEFTELEIGKAQALSDKLSFNTKITRSMTLAEIYNQDELSFTQNKQRNAIGFTAKIN